jgi:hypothetical protein
MKQHPDLSYHACSRTIPVLEKGHVRRLARIRADDRSAPLDDDLDGERGRNRQGVFRYHYRARVLERAFQGVCGSAAGGLSYDWVAPR